MDIVDEMILERHGAQLKEKQRVISAGLGASRHWNVHNKQMVK